MSGTKLTDPIDRTANPRLYQASSWRDKWSLVERIKLRTGARSGGRAGVVVVGGGTLMARVTEVEDGSDPRTGVTRSGELGT